MHILSLSLSLLLHYRRCCYNTCTIVVAAIMLNRRRCYNAQSSSLLLQYLHYRRRCCYNTCTIVVVDSVHYRYRRCCYSIQSLSSSLLQYTMAVLITVHNPCCCCNTCSVVLLSVCSCSISVFTVVVSSL